MPPTRLLVDATDGQVLLRDLDGAVRLGPCDALAELREGTLTLANPVPESGVDGLVVRSGGRGAPELRWHFAPNRADGTLAVWLELHNAGATPLDLEALVVLRAADAPDLEFAFPGHLHRQDGRIEARFAVGTTLPPGATLGTPDLTIRPG